jgi:predicted alpha/beta-fold hydrolase
MALINDGGHVGFQQSGKNPTWDDQMIANLLGVL